MYKLKVSTPGLRETISDEEYENLHPLVQHKYEPALPDKEPWDKLVPGNHNDEYLYKGHDDDYEEEEW